MVQRVNGTNRAMTVCFVPLLTLDISFLQMHQQQLKIYSSQV
jgi:hypothetical protein